MLGRQRKHNRCPIGLDIGEHSIKMLQLSRWDKAGDIAYVAEAAAIRALPANLSAVGDERNSTITELICDMLRSHPFSGRQVVSCMPAMAVQYKNVRLPLMPKNQLQAAIESEAADHLNLSFDDVQLQFIDAGEVRQGDERCQEIILLVADHQCVREHVDLLTACELKPEAIDGVPGALARWVDSTVGYELGMPPKVVLDVGYLSSKVAIISDGHVLFFKLIDIGSRQFEETIVQHLNVSLTEATALRRRVSDAHKDAEMMSHNESNSSFNLPSFHFKRKEIDSNSVPVNTSSISYMFKSRQNDGITRAVHNAIRPLVEQLAKELHLCLRYYSVTFRGRRPDQVLLVGGESYDPHLLKMLAEGIGVNVELGRPLHDIDLSRTSFVSGEQQESQEMAAHGEWALATGLAKRSIVTSQITKRGAA